MMKSANHMTGARKPSRQAGNIFFMLIGAVALIGAMTVAGGNVVKGIVTSMSEVTRKSVADEKMQAAARLAIQSAVNCDTDTPFDFTEPAPFRAAGTLPHPVGGGLVPENIGATLRDPWGTEYGYCAWNFGDGVCTDSPNRLAGGDDPANTVVAVISAGKDRRFSSTCGNTGGGGAYVPAAGAVARWTFDEVAGAQAVDSIGGHNGTYSDSAVPTTAGVVGTAFEFDGANYVSVAGSPNLDLPQYTVAAWVRGSTAPSTAYSEKVISGHVNYGIYWSHLTNPVSCEHMQDGSWIWAMTPPPPITFNAGEWYHLACSYDGTTLRMYVNGTLASSVAATAPEIIAGQPLTIGTGEHSGSVHNQFSGAVDDVLVFNRALSDSEIADIRGGSGSPGVIRDAGSDDIVFEYTYNDAIGLGGDDLWRMIDTRPGTAGIDRNIDVAGGAELSGPLNLMRAGLILPGDDATGPCTTQTDQQLRINFSNNPAVLEICDYTGGNGWIAVSMGDGNPPSDCIGLGDAYYNDPASGHCYFRSSTTAANIDAAQAACATENGYLATITSATEQTAVQDNMPLDEQMWIGKNDRTTSGTWFYSYGERAGQQFWSGDASGGPIAGQFNNWRPSQPDDPNTAENCAIIGYVGSSGWDDYYCETPTRYMCELPDGARESPVRRVQYAVAAQPNYDTNPVTATLSSPPTAGNLLVVIAGHRKSSGDNTISGSGWTQHVNLNAHSADNDWRRGIAIWSKIAGPAEPASITVDLGNENASLIVQEFTAGTGTLAFNNYAQTTGPATNAASVSTGTTAATSTDISLSVAVAAIRDDPGVITWGDGIENVVSPSTTNTLWLSSGYRVNSTTGTQTSTASYPVARGASAAIINFSVTPGGGGSAPTNGLVAYWPFTTAPTAGQDASGNGHNSTWGFGGDPYEVTWTPNGRVEGGAASDGAPDEMRASATPALNLSSYTLSAWIRPENSWSVYGTVVAKSNTGGKNYAMYVDNSGQFNCEHGVNSGADTISVGGPITFSQWSHVLCTYDNTTKVFTAYVNGSVVGTTVGHSTPDLSTEDIWISWDHGAINYAYNGLIDELRIYNRALSASEVTAVHTDGNGSGDDEGNAGTTETFLIHPEMPYCTTAAPGPLVRVSESDNANFYRFLTKAGDYLFSGGLASGISAFRTNGDNTVTRLDTHTLGGGNSAMGMYSNGTHIFSANSHQSLVAYTFDGTDFTEVASIDTPSYSLDVTGDGRYLYVSDTDAIRAYRFDGTAFTLLGEYPVAGSARQAWSDGLYIYAAAYDGGLYILTFNGTSFTLVQHLDPPGNVFGSAGDGKYLYVGEGSVVNIYTFNGTALTQVGSYDPGGGRSVWTVSGDGKNLYFGLSNNELVVARFNGTYVHVLNTTMLPDLAFHIRSDGNLLYVTLENGPMQVFSGVGCLGESSRPAGIANSGMNSYDGKLAIARGSACAIKQDNSVWCWGSDANGILGVNGTMSNTDTPVRIHDPNGYKQIVGGIEHMCGLRIDGSAWCWGSDYLSQLGNGAATADQPVPSAVSGGRRWAKLAAGNAGTCGIEETGDMYCWGTGTGGRIGDGASSTRATPRLVSGGIKWSDVATAGARSCGIDTLSQLWCWGNNADGRLGLGPGYANSRTTPARVADPGPWVRVATGNGRICGIKADGSLWCWGLDANGATGVPAFFNATGNIPAPVAGTGPWASVSLGDEDDSCGIKQDGTAWCWGLEVSGNFGNGAASGIKREPDRVLDPGPWANIQISGSHTCGTKTDGSVWCWGTDLNGRLGNGSTITGLQNIPSRVVDFPGAATWVWDATARNITASGAATRNISLGANGVMGYQASGYAYDCAGLGDSHYNDPATGHCYFKTYAPETWDEATRVCSTHGAYLAVPSSNEEQTKLLAAFGEDQVWLGARDTEVEGEWRYSGGELDRQLFWLGNENGAPQNGLYNYWARGEPNNSGGQHCLTFAWDTDGLWDDEDCNGAFSYICEIGTTGAGGGISFPAPNTLLRQYSSGSELLLETSTTNTSSQIAWGVPAGNDSRAMGINHTTGDLIIGTTNTAMTNWVNTITPQMKVSPEGRVGVGVTGSVYTRLDINGGLRLGNDTAGCNVMREGTLRYVGGATPFEYCNGTAWVPM